MSVGEMKRMQSDIAKPMSENNFDPDKRVEVPVNRETDEKKAEKEKVFDPDKRVEAPVNKETDAEKAEKPDSVLEQIEQKISTKDGLKELMERHPEKKELWDRISKALDTLNDPEASILEKNNAQRKIDRKGKGDILEIATKDALAETGLDVESKQRNVNSEIEGKGTKPDAIAHNNTDRPIEVLGTVVQPGESLYVECKCGIKGYLNNELKDSEGIPKQLSGHKEGKSVLLTTSDMKATRPGLAEEVCDKYNTKLVVSDVSAKQVENTMKEVFGK